MTIRTTLVFRIVAAISLLGLVSEPGRTASPAPTPTRTSAAGGSTVTCAFSNPGYSGWCRQNVAVGAGKSARTACASVLACLNDVRCTKTYCDATTVRGGWKLAKVERSSGTP